MNVTNKTLWYAPEWGNFYRNGKRAGWLDGIYRRIRYKGKVWREHRLAFLFMRENIPNQVDHEDTNSLNNKWKNIRPITPRKNCENKTNNSKFVGVSWYKRKNKWQAYTSLENGKVKHLGNYITHLAACMSRHNWEVNHARW